MSFPIFSCIDGNFRRHPPYCDCSFPSSVKISCGMDLFRLTNCRCGEEDSGTNVFAWDWHRDRKSDIKIYKNEVAFHPVYSTGTAIIRGSKSLDVGMVHFWEMRVITPLMGTDVMFGIGTDQVDLQELKSTFNSGLGLNDQSWGYSYTGKLQHNGKHTTYGHKFSQGCIVGIYLDRVLGYLEYFLNRTSLGVAFRNIPLDPNVKLYPMVSSTDARSVVRLMNATSKLESLQLRAMRSVAKNPQALKTLKEMPGFRKLLMDYWFLAPNVRVLRQTTIFEDIVDEAVMGAKALNKKYKPDLQDNDIDVNDIYSNIEATVSKPPSHHSDSDDEHCVDHLHYLL